MEYLNRRDILSKAVMTPIALAVPLLGTMSCGEAPNASSSTLVESNRDHVIMYDTYAMALYFDGGLGPRTGIISVDHILADEERPFQFWHGHGGQQHRFTLTRDHIAALKRLERVYITTTVVAGHSHKLFIDPTDVRYRVAGAPPRAVPIDVGA